MSILARYIARLFALNILTLLVVLFSLIVSVDVVVNLRRFSDAATRAAEAGGRDDTPFRHIVTTALLVIDLWLPRLLQLFVYLNPVVLIAAMGFTCALLGRHREFVAMLAGGISLNRAARPFLAVAALMLALQALTQERLIPPSAHLLARDPADSGKRVIDAFPVALVRDAQDRLWAAQRFDDATDTLTALWIWERTDTGELRRVITAPSARWEGERWLFEGGLAQDRTSPDANAPARPIGTIDTNLDPTRLKAAYLQGFAQSLSWRQLKQMAAQEGLDARARERLDRLRWGRVSGLISALLAFWASLPLFLVKQPGGTLGASLRAAPIALAGFAASAAATSVAIPGLPPAFGAFMPCLVLLALVFAVASTVRT
ncbi:MAG TPA: hypothetical protein DEB06_07390 [Phycisphaerales bacterium]|nr:hypothetical protein [Phycisphaerales bacterium]